MPHLGPIKRKDLIHYLRLLGFDGPFSGGKHQFLVRGSQTLHIPNPHTGDISEALLSRLLKQTGISKSTWEKL